MPGLGPGIHDFAAMEKTWMAGTGPAMTVSVLGRGQSGDKGFATFAAAFRRANSAG